MDGLDAKFVELGGWTDSLKRSRLVHDLPFIISPPRDWRGTHRNHQELRRVKRPRADDNFLLRSNLIHNTRRMVHESNPHSLWLLPLFRLVKVDLPHGSKVQHVKVLPALGLLEVTIVAGAAHEAGIEVARPLLHAGAVARVVVLDDGDLQSLGSGLDEPYARGRDIALESELEGTIGVGGGVVGLVGDVEASDFVVRWRVEVRTLLSRQ